MSQRVKKFCLIFWKDEKSYSVMEEPEDLSTISNGEEIDIPMEDTSYKGVILARSGTYL